MGYVYVIIMMIFLFLLLLDSCTPSCSFPSNCTVEEQHDALTALYSAWSGPSWRKSDGWLNDSMTCEDSRRFQQGGLTGSPLPAHCCWHGITCCLKSTCSMFESFDVDRCGCEPGLVWAIELDNNNLEGNFSSLDHSAFACSLYGLRVPNNKLFGSIGQDFTLHRKLGYAELQGNNLQGMLPKELGKVFNLWSLSLSGNKLEGPVPPDICGENTKLFGLSVDRNSFSGILDLANCTQLRYFDAKGNNFSSIFTSALPNLPSLRGAYMGENAFKGVIPKDDLINRFPQLEELVLFQNQISGPLPEITMFSMQFISLADNCFTGAIPKSWSRLAHPDMRVFLQTNYLSCCGTNPLPAEELISTEDMLRIDEVYQGVDYSAPRLPSFLELSDVLVPILALPHHSFKANGLRCPMLMLSKEANVEPSPGQPTRPLQWFLDPPYYLWEKCECEEGLTLVNLTKPGRLPYLECQAIVLNASDDQSWEEAYPWAIVIIVIVGCALLITLLLGLYLYKGTEVVQRLNNLKKRIHGLPTSGPFTAVVTDIQGWTGLCAQYPELASKVLSIHNSILRQAKWNNFGSTHETEGDSFTMVFFCARDAVAFCLQAQEMLSKQKWPSHREENPEEQSSLLLSSYDPSSQSGKKSRSTTSFMVLNPLSSSKSHLTVEQERIVSLEVRVRMGLASGFLHPGQSLHSHPTLAFAKEVSNAAVGGQILMEGSTFHAVKESLGELGTVDAQGMHLDRLRMRRVSNWSACFLCGFIAPSAASNEDAVVLDMGSYAMPRLEQEQLLARASTSASLAGRSSKSIISRGKRPLTRFARRASKPDPEFHLYQVLSAAGAERAKLWGNNLRLKAPLKDSLSKGYFDAPGTGLAAPLGTSKGPADVSLPLVTTVFASVENAKVFSSREIRQIERNLLACASHCLDLEQLQGDGYFCRSFGNLKLMLCFSKPEAALVWSCAMQECMMAWPWPKAALKEPFEAKHDQHGQLIFRGPRLKVGISEGRPDSIQPDHLGRADYHGDCVNSAARVMEGTAQGGMVVCEQEVAMRAAEAWAAMQPCSGTEQATDSTLQTRSWSALLSAQSSYGASALDQVQLKALASSRASPCSEPLYLLHPPLRVLAPVPGLKDGSGSDNKQKLGSIHVFWLGVFRFKGIAHAKSMVYVLQDKLASRAAKFTPKSLNPAVATLEPQQRPEGPSKSNYLVPLPAIGTELATSQEQGARVATVQFEQESLCSHHDSSTLMKMSAATSKETLSAHSQDIAPLPSP